MIANNIYLVTYKNYQEIIEYIKENRGIDDYLLFVFSYKEFKNYMTIINQIKKVIFEIKREIFLRKTIVISDRELVANDLCVKATLWDTLLTKEKIKSFLMFFKSKLSEKKNIDEILKECKEKSKFKIDIYNNIHPWIISINNIGLLFLNKYTYNNINLNFNKIRNLSPDITVVTLNHDNYDEEILKMLKAIGSDARITLGLTSKSATMYNKRLDGLIYSKSPFKETYTRKFLQNLLENPAIKNPFDTLRLFLNVEEKDFSADLSWDEENDIHPTNFLKLKYLLLNKKIDLCLKDSEIIICDKKRKLFYNEEKYDVFKLTKLK